MSAISRWRRFALALVALAGGMALPPHGAPAAERLDPAKALARSEAAVGRALGGYTLIDAGGGPLALRDYRGKPLVVSLVYTACSSVCPTATQHLINSVADAGRVFGPDRFAVLTIGFDARNDTPKRLAQFASAQGIAGANWRLASADSGTIEALLRDLGFSYAAIAGGFDHVTQTTIIDPDGKIYRHVYGDDFPLQMFIEPLKDVIYGTTASFTFKGVIDRIKFICTTFDPGAGRYRIDYGLMFGSVIAAISLMIFGGLILREWLRAGRGPQSERPLSAHSRESGNPDFAIRHGSPLSRMSLTVSSSAKSCSSCSAQAEHPATTGFAVQDEARRVLDRPLARTMSNR